MGSLEDKIAEKLYKAMNFTFSIMVKPDMKFKKVTDINKNRVRELKEEYGVEAIILDVDETLRKDMDDIPSQNKEWINSIKKDFKVIVVSNGIDKKMEEYFNSIGVEYINFALKPLKSSFIKACKKVNVRPEKTLVVGDSLISDIFGGKRNKMKTAIVTEVEDEEER